MSYHNVEALDYPESTSHRWLFGLVGVPAAQSSFGQSEDVLALKGIYTDVLAVSMVDDAEFIDVSFGLAQYCDLPKTYGGMSGSGLWAGEFADEPTTGTTWTHRLSFAGVAFYETLNVSGLTPSGVMAVEVTCLAIFGPAEA